MNRRNVGTLTGSAPFATMRNELRSSPSRSASAILLRHNSNPKFGDAENVARNRWIAQSQLSGRTRKLNGDIA